MSDDNVIQAFRLASPLPECGVQVQPDRSYCRHPAILIDEHCRSITCKKCGGALDAFDYLRQNGRELQRMWSDYKLVEERVKAMQSSIETLLREEKRLKASVRRLRDRAGDALDVRKPL